MRIPIIILSKKCYKYFHSALTHYSSVSRVTRLQAGRPINFYKIPCRYKKFSSSHKIQTSFRVHKISHEQLQVLNMAWIGQFNFIQCLTEECVEHYLHSLICIFYVCAVTVLAWLVFSFLLTERSRKQKGRTSGLRNVTSLTVAQVHCHFGESC